MLRGIELSEIQYHLLMPKSPVIASGSWPQMGQIPRMVFVILNAFCAARRVNYKDVIYNL